MIRVSPEKMEEVLSKILKQRGCKQELARRSARLLVENSLDGVYSHGIYRFERVVEYLEQGYIRPEAEPEVELSLGALERWNGNLGMGNVNAELAMARALELAATMTVGIVAMRNTNHWMRGGAYGWQAAGAGMIGMCWTNTLPNMPAWGTREANIGNNPVVLAVPRSNGEHVVVDCALAQFSYGKISEYRRQQRELPVAGGFDSAGELSSDPTAIEEAMRVLPAGFWKGSGLSIAFDLIGAILAGGDTVTGVGKHCDPGMEYGVSQVFMAIDPGKLNAPGFSEQIIDEVLGSIKSSSRAEGTERVFYPGERSLLTRRENLELGIPVDTEIWQRICRM